jgi:hypothetical protein
MICWAAIRESTRSDSSFQTIQASLTISCCATTSSNLKGNAERRNLTHTSPRLKHRAKPRKLRPAQLIFVATDSSIETSNNQTCKFGLPIQGLAAQHLS